MSAARILVVEDNPSDIYVLRHCLNELREAYDLQVVPDGESALEFIRSQREDCQDSRPCVILLDLHLPKHSGLEVLRAIRQEPALTHIHVLVLTSAASPSEEAAVRRLGAMCRLKPAALADFSELAADIIAICKGFMSVASA